ncbi:MAG: hypothetical protein QOC69_4816, partial [Mycobacterium sp.]|nr:hypothetical protein [Mycobacterium sp.]
MTTRNVVITLLGTAVIVGTAACGVSSRPIAITLISPSATTSIATPTSPTTAPSACTDLGGTVGQDQTCQVHTATSDYTLDLSFPVDYPDQRAVTAALTKQRDQFIDLVGERPHRDAPYALAVTGRTYRSGAPASGTESLVFEEYFDTGGAHPETYYESLNYDLGRAAPITFDTLFEPGTDPLGVLDPI